MAPARTTVAGAPSGVRKEASTTVRPASAPTDKSIAPTSTVMICASETKVRMARKASMVEMLKGGQEERVDGCRAGENDPGEHGEHGRREMITGQDPSPSCGAVGARCSDCTRNCGGQVGFGDGSVGKVGAGKLSHDLAAREDQRASQSPSSSIPSAEQTTTAAPSLASARKC